MPELRAPQNVHQLRGVQRVPGMVFPGVAAVYQGDSKGVDGLNARTKVKRLNAENERLREAVMLLFEAGQDAMHACRVLELENERLQDKLERLRKIAQGAG